MIVSGVREMCRVENICFGRLKEEMFLLLIPEGTLSMERCYQKLLMHFQSCFFVCKNTEATSVTIRIQKDIEKLLS